MSKVLTILFSVFALCSVSVAQISTPAPSPSAILKQTVGLTEFTVDYSRPSMKDRKIFADDGLVPYGEIWRTGANNATTITGQRQRTENLTTGA